VAYSNLHRNDFSYDDLEEGPRFARESPYKRPVIIAGFALLILGLIIVLIRGSMPEQGQQEPRRIFNLYSLRQQTAAAVESPGVSQAQPDVALPAIEPASNNDQAPVTPVKPAVTPEPAESLLKAELVSDASALRPLPVESDTPGPAELERVIVAAKSTPDPVPELVPADPLPKGVTAQSTLARSYEKAELQRGERLPVLAQGPTNAASGTISVLPVLSVKGNQVLLREQPSTRGRILTRLSQGQQVTAFHNDGKWVNVGTNDGTSTVGYVHNSLLEVAPADR